jgi:hypothetical protein
MTDVAAERHDVVVVDGAQAVFAMPSCGGQYAVWR